MTACASCGRPMGGPYCAHCGEQALTARGTTPGGARRWLHRLHASLQALASPPGRLTRDWNEGRRVGYLSPLSLLLWTNVAFFVVQGLSGVSILSWPLDVHLQNDILGLTHPLLEWRRGHGKSLGETFPAVFGALESVHAKSLVVLMVLGLAFLPFVGARGRRPYSAWFTFAAHFFTFALIALSALFPVVMLVLTGLTHVGVRPSNDAIDVAISILEAAMIGWYLYRALEAMGSGRKPVRLLQAVLLVAAVAGVLRLYHLAVFAVTVLAL